MAHSNTFTRSVTGSVTNTLGTLGRSIFNSTIGTFADSETTNQIYKAISKLTNSIETSDKKIDHEALNGRNKPDDLFTIIAGMDIQSSYDFMNKNREFMKRLMRLNKQEKDITLNAIGVDVTGQSNVITNEYVKDYDHVKGNNYLEDYVKTLPQNQQAGDETTMLQLESSNHFNYSGLHNDLYAVNQNLYPDDESKGTFSNKWIVENRNSLMYKTKKLFNSKKIGTIISAFHTNPNRTFSALDNAKSKYGLSHGRNLLTKTAENGANSAYANGYDNPYCRVWTHHHQYDRYYKRIRPFATVDDQGNYVSTLGVKEFHQFPQFSDSNDTNSETVGKWGWKKDSNNGWKYSVLQDNGMVNITPKYVKGEASNIHTKQCMFSIENLAWRGYDPYSFEQALSWEQRGPLGGRIMWFPPYGIQFSETTNTQWTSNTFLGRGEDVYTYTNTRRTGTLSFMMVVDHPSILDYVTWTNANKNVSDTDILRFLAGCGEGDGLRQYAKPTPLTDEYTQVNKTVDAQVEVKEVKKENPVEEEKAIEEVYSFFVFYPNNYSGTYDDTYDDKKGEGYSKCKTKSKVNAIPYLLVGKGAQKESSYNITDEFSGDEELSEEISTWKTNGGNGYEMDGNGLGSDGGYILATKDYQNKGGRIWTGLGANNTSRNKPYNPSTDKKWYYRIDGRYVVPQSKDEEYIHYYNQYLETEAGCKDTKSNGFNKNIASLNERGDVEVTKEDITENDKNYTDYKFGTNYAYTLAEIAYAVYSRNETNIDKAKYIFTPTDGDERMERLKKALNGEIKSISGYGFASSQGYENFNKALAKNRYYTAVHWLMTNMGLKDESIVSSPDIDTQKKQDNETTRENNGSTKGNQLLVGSKNKRYARIDITIKTTASSTSSTANNTETSSETAEKEQNLVNNNGGVSYVGYTTTSEIGYCKSLSKNLPIYKDDKGKKWYFDKDSNKFISFEYDNEEETPPTARYDGKNHIDENRLRYDQEYHFFKVLKQEDPIVFQSLMDKLQYFDPAFHSMTPEGFNGRLTFLQQCMRQGNTVSASDGRNAKSANNLAFGRAPYCVLRLGDFYNQMIVIDNLSINYDPLVWDLNVEGVGVQPLIAHVNLSFTFIGGGDLTGPVRRLQNAMSFNYYANARLYDNRADRIERKWSDKTCGAIEHDEILEEDLTNKSDKFKETYHISDNTVSSFYTTQMYK